MLIRLLLRALGVLFGFTLVLAVALLINTVFFRPVFIQLFFARVAVESLLQSPQAMSSLHLLERYGVHYFDRKLDDVSPEHARRFARVVAHELEILHGYDRSRLSRESRSSYDVLNWFLSIGVAGQPYLFHNWPANPLDGVETRLPDFMINEHQIRTAADARDYVARLQEMSDVFDQTLRGLKMREAQGILPPHFALVEAEKQMRAFISVGPQQNPLDVALAEKLSRVPNLDPVTRKELEKDASIAIEHGVYPAYGRLISYTAGLLSRMSRDDGVWAWPEGADFYAWSVRAQTSLDLPPAQIHATGLSEVARIEAELDVALRAQGRSTGSVAERLTALGEDPRFVYPDSAQGHAQCLADFQHILDEVSRNLSGAFTVTRLPPLEVRPVPDFEAATAPPAYYEPAALDGSRPAVFYVNLRRLHDIKKFQMHTLAYHEGIPGHHLQISVARAQKGLPLFRQLVSVTAYTEGWALYAEQLAWEMGFERDPFDNIGRLQHELFRAVRLVVDTGIHSRHWSRDRALAYMRDHAGLPSLEVTAEVDRYFLMPAQALAYKIGMAEILRQRDAARRMLGPRFDLREFHNAVLDGGAMPLALLDERVRDYLERAGAPDAVIGRSP